MATAPRMFVGAQDDEWVLKLSGDIRCTISPQIESVVQELQELNELSLLVIDLSDATRVDSTGLGLVAKIGTFMLKKRGRRAVVICPPGDVRTELEAIGFDRVFVILDGPYRDFGGLREIALVQRRGEVGELMINAHEELMALSERNRITFGPAVEALRSDLLRREATKQP